MQHILFGCGQCDILKQYSAYYYFNAKPKGEKRKGKLEEEENRGGKGGGTEQPMGVLKI